MTKLHHLPRPKGNSLSVTLNLGKDMLGAPIRYFDELGDTFATSILGQEYVFTRDPDWISEILVRNHAAFLKDKVTRSVSLLVGNGLLTNDDSSWRPRRKAMQAHFQPAALNDLIQPMEQETDFVLRGFEDGATVDIHEAMVRVAMRCALRALFGIDPDAYADVGSHTRAGMDYFSGLFGTMMPLPLWVPTRVNRNFIQARRSLRAQLGVMVEQARRRGSENTPVGALFAAERDALLTREELLDEAMTFLLAGHDPSALSLTYTLGALAQFPLEQAKIHQEIDANQPPSTASGYSAPSALKRALSESLRLYPASWAVGREPRAAVEVCGHKLSSGTQITVHQWAVHRHPRWFLEPDSFMPDRWTAEFTASLPKGAYLPWGTGPRVCIGNHFSLVQMMVSLRCILSRFRLESVQPFPPPLRASITAQPRDPLLLRVHRRSELSAQLGAD